MSIRVFKFNNGEEVIARVSDETDDTLTFAKPRVIAMHPVATGQMQVALVPYTASNPDSDIVVSKAAIVGEVLNPSNEIQDGYLQQTTGIALS